MKHLLNIMTKNEAQKSDEREVRQKYFAVFRDAEKATQLPGIKGHEILPDLVDACKILHSFDVKLPGPDATKRLYSVTETTLKKMPSWRKIQWSEFRPIVEACPDATYLRALYRDNFADAYGHDFEFISKNHPILC